MARKKKPCRKKNLTKRSKAACKAAATRRKRTKRGHTKTTRRPGYSTRKRTRTTRRKSPKRVAAGKKAARTRKRRKEERGRERELTSYHRAHPDSYGERRRKRRRGKRRKNPVAVAETPRRRRRKSHGRRRNPVRRRKSGRKRGQYYSRRRRRPGHRKHRVKGHYKRVRGRKKRVYVKGHMSHEEPKRRRRRSHRRRRNPIRRHRRMAHRRRRNPLSGPGEMFAGLVGVALGFVVAGGADRFAATHAYTNGQDAPAAGQVYNSESISLPIWSNWMRLLAAGVSIGLPMVVAGWVKQPTWKSFWQLATFGAVARTVGKAGEDGVAQVAMMMTTPDPTLTRLYAPEIASAAKLSSAATAALPGASAATFAGLPNGHAGAALPSEPQRRLGVGQLQIGQPIPKGAGFDQYAGWTFAMTDARGQCPPGAVIIGEGGCAIPPANPPSPPAPPVPGNILPPAVTVNFQPPVPPGNPPPVVSPPGQMTTPQAPLPVSPPVLTSPLPPMTSFNPLLACPDDCEGADMN